MSKERGKIRFSIVMKTEEKNISGNLGDHVLTVSVGPRRVLVSVGEVNIC